MNNLYLVIAPLEKYLSKPSGFGCRFRWILIVFDMLAYKTRCKVCCVRIASLRWIIMPKTKFLLPYATKLAVLNLKFYTLRWRWLYFIQHVSSKIFFSFLFRTKQFVLLHQITSMLVSWNLLSETKAVSRMEHSNTKDIQSSELKLPCGHLKALILKSINLIERIIPTKLSGFCLHYFIPALFFGKNILHNIT